MPPAAKPLRLRGRVSSNVSRQKVASVPVLPIRIFSLRVARLAPVAAGARTRTRTVLAHRSFDATAMLTQRHPFSAADRADHSEGCSSFRRSRACARWSTGEVAASARVARQANGSECKHRAHFQRRGKPLRMRAMRSVAPVHTALAANPSLEPTRNGMALGPLRGLAHHPLRGPSATPLRAAQLKR